MRVLGGRAISAARMNPFLRISVSRFSGSRNQYSYFCQRYSSASVQVKVVEPNRCTPQHSLKVRCINSKFHNSKEYPILRGFCTAIFSNSLGTSCICVGVRNVRSESFWPAIASLIKQLPRLSKPFNCS